MPDREEFTSNFNVGNFGDITTEDLINAGENFLNADPDNIFPIKKDQRKQEEEDNEDGENTPPPKSKVKEKSKKDDTPPPPKKEVSDDDIFTVLDNKEEQEEDDDDSSITPTSKVKSKEKAGPPKKEENQQNEELEEEESTFTTIAKELVTLGVFSPDEDDEGNTTNPVINTPEEFAERFQIESRRQAADVIDRFLDKFGPEYRDMFQNVFVNGVPPTEYLSRFSKIEGLEDLDITQEANQERVVRQLLREEGRSADYIEKRVTQLKNYNDLLDEATEAKRLLVEREKKGIEKAAQSKQQELVDKQRIRNEYVQGVTRILQDKLKNKEFDGIPVSREFVEETMNYLTAEKWQTPDKQLLTDFDKDLLDLNHPQNHQLKVKVAMLMQILKTDPQLTKLAKKAVSKETGTLFQGLRKQSRSTGNTKKEDTPDNSAWD